MVNSQRKGKDGELEWVHFLMAHGFDASRGRQYQGSPESPDVKSSVDRLVHWEVKRVEHLHIGKAMRKAVDDAGSNQIPVVAHRRNRDDWLVTLPADRFLFLLREVLSDG